MKTTILLSALIVFTGCNYTTIQRGETKARNSRWFWNTEGFELTTSTNGNTSIKIQKSNPDAESLRAVAAGAAEGTARGMKP